MTDRLFNNDYSLDDLIANKRASGHPKDIVDALILEKLKEKQNG